MPASVLGAPKARLRGVLHEVALYASVPLGVALGLLAADTRAQVSAAVFAAAVVAMFAASALTHSSSQPLLSSTSPSGSSPPSEVRQTPSWLGSEAAINQGCSSTGRPPTRAIPPSFSSGPPP